MGREFARKNIVINDRGDTIPIQITMEEDGYYVIEIDGVIWVESENQVHATILFNMMADHITEYMHYERCTTLPDEKLKTHNIKDMPAEVMKQIMNVSYTKNSAGEISVTQGGSAGTAKDLSDLVFGGFGADERIYKNYKRSSYIWTYKEMDRLKECTTGKKTRIGVFAMFNYYDEKNKTLHFSMFSKEEIACFAVRLEGNESEPDMIKMILDRIAEPKSLQVDEITRYKAKKDHRCTIVADWIRSDNAADQKYVTGQNKRYKGTYKGVIYTEKQIYSDAKV